MSTPFHDRLRAMNPDQVLADAEQRVRLDEERGRERGGEHHRWVASVGRDLLTNHRPSGERPDCTGCDEQWPCSGYAFVLTHD